MKVVIHKSTALVAQTFMIAMANEGYDACPLEGFGSKVLKKTFKFTIKQKSIWSSLAECETATKEFGAKDAVFRLTRFIFRDSFLVVKS